MLKGSEADGNTAVGAEVRRFGLLHCVDVLSSRLVPDDWQPWFFFEPIYGPCKKTAVKLAQRYSLRDVNVGIYNFIP
ncbi:hypothetical protein [Mesorhizobium sp. M1295]|uniref:hypothetical protein n=1 Tax=Mesorhizobium sp. M1295 TaxID=2957076 RepID=UPI00333785A2